MFAKEIFDYPELEEHPLLCNHLGDDDDDDDNNNDDNNNAAIFQGNQ